LDPAGRRANCRWLPRPSLLARVFYTLNLRLPLGELLVALPRLLRVILDLLLQSFLGCSFCLRGALTRLPRLLLGALCRLLRHFLESLLRLTGGLLLRLPVGVHPVPPLYCHDVMPQ
jgi:hypothetical protein